MNITEKETPLKRPSTREDCWSEESSYILIEAWGDRNQLNHGNLRQKHWKEVANVVNLRSDGVSKAPRTDIQCRTRIDTLKKRYKLERARVLASNGNLSSNWPFYNRLHALIGDFAQSSPYLLPLSPPLSTPLASNGDLRRKDGNLEGFREVVKAIRRFGEIYERVEKKKLVQIIELEKQRMETMKSLELGRLQSLVDSQVRFGKIKRAKTTVPSDN